MARVSAADPAFWAGRRVLVTGHTGFKGAWLSLWLRHLGADVHGFALPPATDPSLFELADVGRGMTSMLGDLRDPAQVNDAVHRAAPEIVFHLAAQALVVESLADPVGTMATNVMGTVHLLEALRGQADVRVVLTVTSDKVYANDESGAAFAEDFPLGGKDPYSASKAATELVVRAWRESFLAKAGVRLATARGGNVIGGGDYAADRIVPDVVRAAATDRPVVLRMPGATRPWQHVLDCLAGYILYAQALGRGQAVPPSLNFGPWADDPISVGELARIVAEALGGRGFEHRPVAGSVEMKTLAVDAALARETLGWTDRLPGRRAIDWTAHWYQRVAGGAAPLATTLEQIEAYARG